MEKLIELLNEYSKIRNNARIVEWVEHTKGNLYWEYWENAWSYMVVISKEYGFIKWLVDNDKIDLDKRPTRNKYRLQQYKTELGGYGQIDEYSELLMLLSIQDEPIEYLVSLLKNV